MNYADGSSDSTIHYAVEADEETMCGEDPKEVETTNDESLVTCDQCKEGIADVAEYNKQLAAAPHKPSEYKHIAAWGRMMRSNGWYIKAEQEKAALDNAPLDATYKRGDIWHLYRDCENAGTRAEVDAILERIK